jgi:hypothetical protein
MYPNGDGDFIMSSTRKIIQFLRPDLRIDRDYDIGNGILKILKEGVVLPTDQEIIDAGNDLTTINGQVFSEWYAENGGDATLTLRKRASDLLDKVNDSEALLRALVLVMVDEINILRAEHSLADRTAAQVRTAIKNKLNSGDADG